MNAQFAGWPHVIESQQFSFAWMQDDFFPLADEMKRTVRCGGSHTLAGKKIGFFFRADSVRTRLSFTSAIELQGGRVSFSTNEVGRFSDGWNGSSLVHTVQVASRHYLDALVVRSTEKGLMRDVAEASHVPVINAGDGIDGQHPTQALGDILTIQKRLGHVGGVTAVICGDLANNRAAKSFVYLLAKFPGVMIHLVSPATQKIDNEIIRHLRKHEVRFCESEILPDVIKQADVVYMLRTQREAGSAVYDLTDNFILNDAAAKLAKENAIFMHPLPIDSRVKEIHPAVEKDPRSVFLTVQVDCGLYARMALLKMILAPHI